jgi:hypothetical protein
MSLKSLKIRINLKTTSGTRVHGEQRGRKGKIKSTSDLSCRAGRPAGGGGREEGARRGREAILGVQAENLETYFFRVFFENRFTGTWSLVIRWVMELVRGGRGGGIGNGVETQIETNKRAGWFSMLMLWIAFSG